MRIHEENHSLNPETPNLPSPKLSDSSSMSLEYKSASEPLHISRVGSRFCVSEAQETQEGASQEISFRDSVEMSEPPLD